MKNSKKGATLVLAALLALNLAGCGLVSQPSTKQEDKARLEAILDSVSGNLHPGTAGSSLVSAGFAADLIGWAAATQLSRQEAAQAVADWLDAQTPQLRQAFQEQLGSILNSLGQLAGEGARDLLDSAGVDGTLPAIDSDVRSILSAILSSGGIEP